MVFLEKSNLHYPILSKKYLIRKEKKLFKLMNPYCFPDYLKEVLLVYMNPMKPVSKRKEYCYN